MVEPGQAAAGDVGLYVASLFDATAERLTIWTSDDGLRWREIVGAEGYAPPSSGVVRDPSIIRHRGRWYIAHTARGAAFDVIVSDDLVNWAHVATVPMGAALPGYCWAPEWFRDRDGSLRVYVSAGDTVEHSWAMGMYELHPTDETLATWSAPVRLAFEGGPVSLIDPFMVRSDDGRYCLWYKKEVPGACHITYAAGASPTGPFAVIAGGDDGSIFGGGTSKNQEGVSLVRLGPARWRAYYDRIIGSGIYYRESADDWATWTAEVLVEDFGTDKHPTVIWLGGGAD